ncbi:hypothetical protein [Streptomyces orinoci]|uniref:Uncharacterized protein n=1 Tax=Streptomyces orinoci TaxID=67339 RepID=A0ABV3JQV8_STRON|nr:hypothetical protein [Streptomyces orinoci]
MSMGNDRPSRQQLRDSFHRGVLNALAGEVCTATLVDMDTDEALWAIASAEPADREELVAAAYRAFAGQLDGSNAARRAEEMQRRFDAWTQPKS